ncbi:porin [Gellertiella hungarica]|uniref:Porin n=1 Tax=Gellertiella hungarica TaxID=1572859 RepID=A0A7W6J823_9HYPH|nr:porin [Gellertiella hungarica]MBB4065613.1 hypothetical protein [Gellertiella hungarica]
MNIKSLLLGSAAALVVVSGAQAADAIVTAEPEPAEYVKVCDAFGAGFFYIPGTENCLKIGGYVRFNVGFNSADKNRKWDATTKADINVTAKTETELGALTGFIETNAVADDQAAAANFALDSAYIKLGGLQVGYFAGYFDAGIGENSGWAAKSKFNAVSYTFEGDGFGIGLGLDETGEVANGVGIEGQISAGSGPFSAKLIGVYDTDAENGAIKGIVSAEAGPGTLSVAGVWSNGQNIYTNDRKWAVGAAYSVKASDQLTVMPEFQVSENLAGDQNWFVGALTSYQITNGLTGSVDVNYNKDESVSGYFRLQRSF